MNVSLIVQRLDKLVAERSTLTCDSSILQLSRCLQEVQPHMALRDRTQLWFLRDTRDQAFHLLLLGTGATCTNQ